MDFIGNLDGYLSQAFDITNLYFVQYFIKYSVLKYVNSENKLLNHFK